MANLTAVISWELFKNENCFQSLEQYTQSLRSQLSIPANFIELNVTSSEGLSVKSLPSDCLLLVFGSLENLRESSCWNYGFISIFQFLCLISRRKDNRNHLLLFEYLNSVDLSLQHFFQSARKDAENEHMWLEVFGLASTFMEWLFDQEITWRAWSNSITLGTFPAKPVSPLKGNGYSSIWLRDLIISDAATIPSHYLKCLLDLLCAETATSTVAAWTSISSTLIDSLITAGISGSEDAERSGIITIALTFLIQRLLVMDLNHRMTEPMATVKSFCHMFIHRRILTSQDLLCLSSLLQTSSPVKMVIGIEIKIFYPLIEKTLLHALETEDADLSASLFGFLVLLTTRTPVSLQLPCNSPPPSKSTSPHSDSSNAGSPQRNRLPKSANKACKTLEIGCSDDSGLCRRFAHECGIYSQLLKSLLCFLEPYQDLGFTKRVFTILEGLASWIDGSALLHWLSCTDEEALLMVEESEAPERRTILLSSTVNDGEALGLLLSFASSLLLDGKMKRPILLQETVQRKQLLNYFTDVSCLLSRDDGRGRKNLNECCSSGIIGSVLVPCLLQAFKIVDIQLTDPMLEDPSTPFQHLDNEAVNRLIEHLLLLLKTLGHYSVSVQDVVLILALLRHDCIAKRAVSLLKVLISMVRPTMSPLMGQSNGTFSWLEFNGPSDSLLILPFVESQSIKQSKLDDMIPTSAAVTNDGQNINPLDQPLSALGLSFFMWVCFDEEAPIITPELQSSGTMPQRSVPQRQCLFRILSVAGNGVEVFKSASGNLVVASAQTGEFFFEQVCSSAHLLPGKWTALSFIFSKGKGFFSKSTLTVFVNNDRVFESEFQFPLIKEDLLLFHYGGCPLFVEETCYSGLTLKLPPRKPEKAPKSGVGGGFLSVLGLVSGMEAEVDKRGLPNIHPQHVSMGAERHVWGPLIAFKGRLSMAAVFNEAMSDACVNCLVHGGENNCTLLMDLHLECSFPRLLFFYHARAMLNKEGKACQDLALSELGQKEYRRHKQNSPGDSNILSVPAYLHGAVHLTSIAFVDSIYRLGGIQFLLPFFENIGSYPILEGDVTESLLQDFTSALEKFNSPKEDQPHSRSPSQQPMISEEEKGVSEQVQFTHRLGASSLDDSRSVAALNATIEMLELTGTLIDSKMPASQPSTYNLPVTVRSASRLSALFLLLKSVTGSDPRIRQGFFHPNVILAFGHLLGAVDPLQMTVNAVLNFHNMVDLCASAILADLDSRMEFTGEFDSSFLSEVEKRMVYEDFRIRWIFFTQQIFVDWQFWSQVCPMAALQHVRQLLRKVKLNRRFYRMNLSINCLLSAVGFFFAPKQELNIKITQAALASYVKLKTVNTTSEEVIRAKLINCCNVINQHIRQAFYSMIRLLITKGSSITDLKALFNFLESSAHTNVISEVIVLIARIFDRSMLNDQFSLLVFEPGIAEKLYSVLLASSERMSLTAKQNALKLICKLALSDRVQKKYKSHLFLVPTGGFMALFAQVELLRGLTLCPTASKHLYQLIHHVFKEDHAGLLQYLMLLRLTPIRDRIAAISMLMDLLESDRSSVLAIIDEPAFYDSLLELLLKSPKRSEKKSLELQETLADINEDDDDGFKSSGNQPVKFFASNEALSSSSSVVYTTARRSSTKKIHNALSTSSFIATPSADFPMNSCGSSQGPFFHELLDSKEDPEELEALEITLGELIVECLHKLLWSTVDLTSDSVSAATMKVTLSNYYQVLVGLSDASYDYNFIRPSFWVVQRLLEELLKSMNQSIFAVAPQARLLKVLPVLEPFIRMVVEESCNRPNPGEGEYRLQLLDRFCDCLLELLNVWSQGTEHENLVAWALHFLLTWMSRGSFNDNGSAAQACARLHDAICAFNSGADYERIAFVTFRLHSLIQNSFKIDLPNSTATETKSSNSLQFTEDPLNYDYDNNDDEIKSGEKGETGPNGYYFLAPLLKALLEKYADVMEVKRLAPNLPTQQTANFITEFKNYSQTPEWRDGLCMRLQSAQDSYSDQFIVSPSTEQSLLRAMAHESLVKARRQRCRQIFTASWLLSELYPTFVCPNRPRGDSESQAVLAAAFRRRRRSRTMSGATSATLSATGISLLNNNPNSFGASPLTSASTLDWFGDTTTTTIQDPSEKVVTTLDWQKIELENKVVRSIRRKRWLTLRYEFVHTSMMSPWYSKFPCELRWRLASQETGIRMRGKLEPNPCFTLHLEASRNRDGLQSRISAINPANLLDQLAMEDLNLCQQMLFESVENVEAVRRKHSQMPSADLQRTFSMNAMDQFVEKIPPPKPHHLKYDFMEDVVDEEDWQIVPPANGEKVNEDSKASSIISNYTSVRTDGDVTSDLIRVNSPQSSMQYCDSSFDPLRSSSSVGSLMYQSEFSDSTPAKNDDLQLYVNTSLSIFVPNRPPAKTELPVVSPSAAAAASGTVKESKTIILEEPATLKGELLRVVCQLISLVRSVPGWFVITNSSVHFLQNHCQDVISELAPESEKAHSQNKNSDFSTTLSLEDLREVHLCRYNLRRSAIEVFMVDHRNFLFNFPTKSRNKVFSQIMSLNLPQLIYRKGRSPAEVFKFSHLMQLWKNRDISNFEYLMRLNTIAGRTYNDLSQYPVLPWIIADYTSKRLNLDETSTFRDLSRPVGLVNPENITAVREKFESFEDPTGEISRFHYGTHYSSGAGVMHYLVRVEPFTSLHIQLQGNRFDVADRQFNSIPAAWDFMMANSNDNRELIPEFFFLPDFLRNDNGFDLGRLQFSEETVNHVELPHWASDPEEFIRIHRGALESDYVSANLHKWIDLIFGYKQRGVAAINALNVFYYLTYEGAVDLDDITDPIERESFESMIKNFGQTPCQLLREPHMSRISYSDWVFNMLIHRRLPLINSSILYMKTNMSLAPGSSSSATAERKISVRLARQRTRSTMLPQDEPLPPYLSQYAVEVYFSYHPPARDSEGCQNPVFIALIPNQTVVLPNLKILAPVSNFSPGGNLNLASVTSPNNSLLLSNSTGDSASSTSKSLVASFKSILLGTPSSLQPGSTSSHVALAGSALGQSSTTSHLAHRLLVVDVCGLVRHHSITPSTRVDRLNFSESELASFLAKTRVRDDRRCSVRPDPLKVTPEGISPSSVEMESLRLTVASLRQRYLGPIIAESCTSKSLSHTSSFRSNLYAISNNRRHLYVAGRWDNRMAVYATHSGRLEMLVTSPHTDIITCLTTDKGCFRKSTQLDSTAQYLITGSRDGTTCVWNFGVVSNGSRRSLVRQDQATINAFHSERTLIYELAKQKGDTAASLGGTRGKETPGYPAEMQEEVEASMSAPMPFDDIMVDCGFGSKITDLSTNGSRRSSLAPNSQNQHPLSPAKELAKVLRVFPSDGSGQPINQVALYLALDMALCATEGSNLIRIFSVIQGVWARSVLVGGGVPKPLEIPTSPLTAPEESHEVNVNHLLLHSPSISFIIQWTLKSHTDKPLLKVTRYNLNGRRLAECNLFPEATRYLPTHVTQMLTATLSPSANAKRVVHHVLLVSTASGHVVMREAESLSSLRIFSIGVPIADMSILSSQHAGGVNLVLALASGGFVVAYPGLTSPAISGL